jgi:hypothetical protein
VSVALARDELVEPPHLALDGVEPVLLELDSYTLELQQHGLESVEREVRWLDELIASEREHPQHDTAAPSGQPQHTTSGAGNQPSAHGV